MGLGGMSGRVWRAGCRMAESTNMPHFVIIGAMKCATTTLHDQLAMLPGVFMSTPKEPNFFSDDDVWSRGMGWYTALFADAPAESLRGESSTHYTKLPTYPETADRFHSANPGAKLVYVMRDPIDRLVSQYIHEWSVRKIHRPIDEAVRAHPELLDYSRYAYQLRPWIERFGAASILPVFFERLTTQPQAEFERVCRFIGYGDPARWDTERDPRNVSALRARRSPFRDRVLANGAVTLLRRKFVPSVLRERVKRLWRMDQRPVLSEPMRRWCEVELNPDMRALGELVGLRLTCGEFSQAVCSPATSPEWAISGVAR